MEGFAQRLYEEQQQLEERLIKLSAFINSEKINTVDPAQKHLLRVQKFAMETYNACLISRLALLGL